MSLEGLDLNSVASQFLSAYPNANAAVSSGQLNVVQSMIQYFNAYRSWAEAPSSFANDTLHTAAKFAQTNMIAAMEGLYAAPGNPPLGNPVPMKTV